MRPVFTIDRRSMNNLQNSLKAYSKATGKSMASSANRAAVNLAFRSAQWTKKAVAAEIKAGLQQQVATEVFTKTGKRRKKAKAIYGGNMRALNIVRGKLAKQGRRDVPLSELQQLAKQMIAKRLASVAFIRAGWSKAGRDILGALKRPPEVKVRGERKREGRGRGIRARISKFSFATLINRAVVKGNKTSVDALNRYGGAGLSRAVRFVTKDIAKYAKQRLGEQASKFNKR